MIVVDASCLYEVLVDAARAETVHARLAIEPDQVAPHVIDVEVFGLIRRDAMRGVLDEITAELVVEDLRTWPADRFSHRGLLERAWELRDTVRGWDAMYVALAEIVRAPLVTLDARLASAPGPRCQIEVVA
ncbi:type II toxin-antitoxin system ribonuclease VapC1 [soil metagenome]